MQSIATDVSSYLQELPDDRRVSLTKLRQLCLDTLVGYEEGMDYGMPGYNRPQGRANSKSHFLPMLYCIARRFLSALHRLSIIQRLT